MTEERLIRANDLLRRVQHLEYYCRPAEGPNKWKPESIDHLRIKIVKDLEFILKSALEVPGPDESYQLPPDVESRVDEFIAEIRGLILPKLEAARVEFEAL